MKKNLILLVVGVLVMLAGVFSYSHLVNPKQNTPLPSPAPVPSVGERPIQVAAAEKEGAECNKVVALVWKQKEAPSFPQVATAKITYCETYRGKVTFKVQAENFPPQQNYFVTINGWAGRAGNKVLLQYNKTEKGEGYLDVPMVSSDINGRINAGVETDLEPGKYEVKLFLKQNTGSFLCVMGADSVSFTVEAAGGKADPAGKMAAKGDDQPSADGKITITLPKEIQSDISQVEGTVSPAKSTVFVIIRGEDSDRWWVQEETIVDSKGEWSNSSHFGEKGTPVPKNYQVIALVGKPNEFSNGQTIMHKDLNKVLQDHPLSAKKTVLRTK
jgi:hypothetical protein